MCLLLCGVLLSPCASQTSPLGSSVCPCSSAGPHLHHCSVNPLGSRSSHPASPSPCGVPAWLSGVLADEQEYGEGQLQFCAPAGPLPLVGSRGDGAIDRELWERFGGIALFTELEDVRPPLCSGHVRTPLCRSSPLFLRILSALQLIDWTCWGGETPPCGRQL